MVSVAAKEGAVELWTHECPKCGADVPSDFGEGDFTCPECGKEFTVEIVERGSQGGSQDGI